MFLREDWEQEKQDWKKALGKHSMGIRKAVGGKQLEKHPFSRDSWSSLLETKPETLVAQLHSDTEEARPRSLGRKSEFMSN